jgi:hypothetical protein
VSRTTTGLCKRCLWAIGAGRTRAATGYIGPLLLRVGSLGAHRGVGAGVHRVERGEEQKGESCVD